jgi:uroporphyrinogen III methyltransferase / synthase
MLQGKRIVVTRAAEQSGPLAAALREHGADPVVLPLIAIAPPDDVMLLDEAVGSMARFDWIFFTSQNAVRALQDACVRSGLTLQKTIGAAKIGVVGPTTGAATRDVGLQVNYEAVKHDGVSLVRELASEVKGKRVLLPRSDRANPDLVRELQQLGAVVTDVVAYKTVRHSNAAAKFSEAIGEGAADAVLFFSPSAVHHFQELAGPEEFRRLSSRIVFAAIGPVTGAALRAAGIERLVLAEDTTVDGVLRVLVQHFAASGAALPAGVKRG